jgi:hypothetical protein
MCWIIYVVVILKTYVFLSYMLCFILFHLYFKFYKYKVCTMSINQ